MKVSIGRRENIRVCYCHYLPGHPKCGRLHGHNGVITAEIRGEVDSDGFVVDFGEVKTVLRAIGETLDHRTLIPIEDAVIDDVLDQAIVSIPSTNPERKSLKRYIFPMEDVILLRGVPTSTAESMAKYVADRAAMAPAFQRPTIKSFAIGWYETDDTSAWDSRGLKKETDVSAQ